MSVNATKFPKAVYECQRHKIPEVSFSVNATKLLYCRLPLCLRMMQSGNGGQAGPRNVGHVGSVCQLARFRLVTYWLIFYQSDLLISVFKKLNNACLQEEVRHEQHTP